MARSGERRTRRTTARSTPPLWLILFGATFDWTGDRQMVDRLWPNAVAAMRWIDEYGDRDRDGFVEYERRSDRGLLNQGWKDSSDAIRIAWEGGPADRACRGPGLRLRRQAANGTPRGGPWRDRSGHPARRRGGPARDALRAGLLDGGPAVLRDRAGPRQAAGRRHRQQCGPVSVDRHRDAGPSARRHGPDPATGDVLRLGVRTLAIGPARLQPDRLSHGNGLAATSLIAAGFKQYGFDDATNRLVGQMMEAAQGFPDYRLPELFCGFDRTDAHTGPLSGGVLAASVGGRFVVPLPGDHARLAGPRRR